MPSGSLTPHDYPTPEITIRCDECDRTGRYSRASLAARYGDDAPLPHVLDQVTACVRNERLSVARCRAYYVGLREQADAMLAAGR